MDAKLIGIDTVKNRRVFGGHEEKIFILIDATGSIRRYKETDLVRAMKDKEIKVCNMRLTLEGKPVRCRAVNEVDSVQEKSIRLICHYLGIEYTKSGLWYEYMLHGKGALGFISQYEIPIPWRGYNPKLGVTVMEDKLVGIKLSTEGHNIDNYDLPISVQVEYIKEILEGWRKSPGELRANQGLHEGLIREMVKYENARNCKYELKD